MRRNRGDRRGLNPRQLEPQGSTRAGKRNDCEGCSLCEETDSVPEYPGGDGHSAPGADIRCGDCAHFRRCEFLLSRRVEDKPCDWVPSRLVRAS